MRWSYVNLKAIMNTLIVLSLVLCFQTVKPGAIEASDDVDAQNMSWVNNSAEIEKTVEEKMKELRIEMVKLQILSKLNMKEPPNSVSSPTESSREAIRLLLQGTTEEQPENNSHPSNNEERLIIHAKSNDLQCLHSNDSFCKMYRFELKPALNMSSLHLWIFKLAKFPHLLSLSLSYFISNKEKYYDKYNYGVEQIGWNKLQLPRINLPSSCNDSITYSVEINGEGVEHRSDHRPFLMVVKTFPIASRQRRDISCDTNESCCLKPLRVSFAEIGFNWVLYPVELEANMCTGKCRMDHSAMRTHYETAITKVLENDSTLQESLGECWTLCCKPKQLESVRVIYNDTDGIFHDQYIPELSVKSCSCS